MIVRKNISVPKGEKALLDEVRYFFYITNRKDTAEKIVGLANGRCDQENVIEQLKTGVNALRMPVNLKGAVERSGEGGEMTVNSGDGASNCSRWDSPRR